MSATHVFFFFHETHNTRNIHHNHSEGHAIRRKAAENDDRIRRRCWEADGAADGAAGGRLDRDNRHRRRRRTKAAAHVFKAISIQATVRVEASNATRRLTDIAVVRHN